MSDQEKIEKKKEAYIVYAYYSGLILKMVAMVLAGAWIGRQIDDLLANNFPLFTVSLISIAAFGALWYFIKALLK